MLLRVGRHFRGSAVSPAICERWCSRSQNAYLEDLVAAAFVKAAERWCWLIALVFLRETFVGVCARHTYPSVYHCQRRAHHFWPHLLSQRVLPSLASLERKKWEMKSRKVCDVRQKFQSGKREIGSPITSQLLNFDIMFPGNVVHTQCYLYVNCNNSPPPLSNVLRVLLRSRQNIGWPFPGFVSPSSGSSTASQLFSTAHRMLFSTRLHIAWESFLFIMHRNVPFLMPNDPHRLSATFGNLFVTVSTFFKTTVCVSGRETLLSFNSFRPENVSWSFVYPVVSHVPKWMIIVCRRLSNIHSVRFILAHCVQHQHLNNDVLHKL